MKTKVKPILILAPFLLFSCNTEEVECMDTLKNDSDFETFANCFYSLDDSKQDEIYEEYIKGKEVIWTGTIVDTETFKDSVLVYGKDNFDDETYEIIRNFKEEMVPYLFTIELEDETGLKKGDIIKVKTTIFSRGFKELELMWHTRDSKIIK